MRVDADLDQLPADPMEHRFESIVGAKLLIDVVKVIPKSLRGYFEFVSDVTRAPALGEASEHSMFLIRQGVHWSRPQRIIGHFDELLRHAEHPLDELLRSLPTVHIASEVDDPTPSGLRILVDHGRQVHPESATRARIDLQIEIGNRRPRLGTIAQVTMLRADQRPEHVASLEQLKARFTKGLITFKSEELRSAGVP